jgi:hypothetical protein
VWINNFLENRLFYVNINNYKSLQKSINSGVSQGSTISSTLFSAFFSDIDDLKLNRVVKIALYADNLCIWFSSKCLKDIQIALQSAIQIIEEFFNLWCIALNSDKTAYSIFTTAGKRKSYERLYKISLTVNNKQIFMEHYPKLLGITVDPKVDSTFQINCK